jgi:hypothetical protein
MIIKYTDKKLSLNKKLSRDLDSELPRSGRTCDAETRISQREDQKKKWVTQD